MSEISWQAYAGRTWKLINITEGEGTQYISYHNWDLTKPVGWAETSSIYTFVFKTATYQDWGGGQTSQSGAYTFSGYGNLYNVQSDYYPVFNNINDAYGYNSGGTYDINNLIAGTIPEPPIVYNWQSVPSISGKNGILSLVTLDSESINDGEPVSGAAVSVFDQNPVSGNNVKDIVDENIPLIPSVIDVTAAFIISNPPVGELASRILAAKKDSIPESIEDADKTVSIPANASNVTMPGLDENSKYYFAIFISDASGNTAVSDPKDIITGLKPPIPPNPEIIMIVEKALIDGYEEYISAELVQ